MGSSFILRLKRLECLTTPFSKLIVPHSCGNFQNIHTNHTLFSKITKNFIIHDLRASAQATKNSDFGKVVDLDNDFDQLRVDNDYYERARFKEKVNSKSMKKRQQLEEPFKNEEADEKVLNEKKIAEEIEVEPDELQSESENNIVKKQNFKLSEDNCNIFRNVMTTLKSRKLRERKEKIILEGKRLIQDALSAGHKPLRIFFSRFSDLRTLNLPEDVEVTQVPYKTLSLWSDVVTSQGVIGVFKMPQLRISNVSNNAIPLTVICDNVRDPANLGSIIRTVAAVGGQELILTTGCADIWDPKVLRAGAGAHFRLPIANNFSWADIENAIPEGVQIVLADNEVPAVSNGVSEDDQESHAKNSSFKSSSKFANSLPLHCYTSFRYGMEAVIVLGGETFGLSDEAYQFAINRNGSRVCIPMGNATESLNNAMSLGIISYEFRRQFNFLNEETSEEIYANSSVEKTQ